MNSFQHFFDSKIVPVIQEAESFSIKVSSHGFQRLYQANLVDFQKPGCYLAFDASCCLYIGSSVNIKRRFGSHFFKMPDGRFWSCKGYILHTGAKAPPNSHVVALACEDFKMLERFLVLKFRPAHNKNLTGQPQRRWKRK